jgi:hypothetical protein
MSNIAIAVDCFAVKSTPIPPVISGLVLDLGSVVTLSSGMVATWSDQSGNGNDFTGTAPNQPPWNVSDSNLNGLPSAGPFNTGSGSGLQYSGSNTYAAPWTILVLAYAPTVAAGNLYEFAQTVQGNLYVNANTQHFIGDNGGATDIATASGVAVGAMVIAAQQDANGGTDKLWRNALTSAATASVAAGAPPPMLSANRWIGTHPAALFNNNFSFHGTIARIRAYSRLLTAPEFSAEMTYLGAIGGVTIGP